VRKAARSEFIVISPVSLRQLRLSDVTVERDTWKNPWPVNEKDVILF
jgi:hypothetical protein